MSGASRLRRARAIHLVGAGGIGVSAAGTILLAHGKRVTGSDLAGGRAVRSLVSHGARVAVGPHRAEHLRRSTDLVVHTLAAPSSNPELREARRRGVPTWSYPMLLGELMRGYYGVTVSGTHGKTTTTAMLAEALVAAKLDPTVVVGSFVRTLGGNARVGRGSIFLAEACEYQRAFLHYAPRIIVLTNIEAEHLDTYGTFARLQQAFERYVRLLPVGGWLVANADDPVVRAVAAKTRAPVVWYSTRPNPTFRLKVPGVHNQANASAALAAAELLGADPAVARRAIERFAGTWRRFELLGTVQGITVVDDYAHHPTEIRATLAAARERFPGRRIVAAFEPHHEHRTRVLLGAFSRAFDRADRVVLAPIYQVAGREERAAHRVTSATLATRLRNRGMRVALAISLTDVEQQLRRILRPGDVLVVMGAGTITQVAHRALRWKKKQR